MPDDAIPMTDRDIEPAAPTDKLEPMAPPKITVAPVAATEAAQAKVAALGERATDHVRLLASDGKGKASGALDQLAKLLTDAAGNVDGALGTQYGDYARRAATSVTGLAERLDAKNVDDLVADVRDFVRKSPGAAIGIAAALGFVVARAVQSGIDDQA